MFLCYFLRKKDSKSRTKINSSPGLIRAYVRTDGRGRLPNFLGLMDLPIPIAMDAPPAGAEDARGSSTINWELHYQLGTVSIDRFRHFVLPTHAYFMCISC